MVNNKHRQCETAKEYLELIANEGYRYTIEDLSEMLDMTEQYIQINFIDRLDTLYIDKENKLKIRGLISLYQQAGDIYIRDDEIKELIINMIGYKDKLKKKILINQVSINQLLMDIFKKEVEEMDSDYGYLLFRDRNKNTDKKLVPLSEEDIDMIFDSELKLRSTKSLKEYFGVKYDAQLYRELKWRRYIKFVCEDKSKKHNRVRYIVK